MTYDYASPWPYATPPGHVSLDPPAVEAFMAEHPSSQPARHDAALSFEDACYALDGIDTTAVVSRLDSATDLTVETVIDGHVRELSVRGVRVADDSRGVAHVTLTAS